MGVLLLGLLAGARELPVCCLQARACAMKCMNAWCTGCLKGISAAGP